MPVSKKFARLHPAMVAMQLARSNELAYRSQVLSDDHRVIEHNILLTRVSCVIA